MFLGCIFLEAEPELGTLVQKIHWGKALKGKKKEGSRVGPGQKSSNTGLLKLTLSLLP